MGADNLKQFPRWRRWTEIFGLVPIAIFRRSHYPIEGKAVRRFARYRRPAGTGKKLALLAPPAWLVLDNQLNLLSATDIRRHSLTGKDLLSVAKSKRKTKPSKNKFVKRKSAKGAFREAQARRAS